MRQFLFALTIAAFSLFFCSCQTARQLSVIKSDNAPKAIGPYSQGIVSGDFIFTSGQITGVIAGEDIASQTHQAMKNISAVLEEGGSDLSHIMKVTVFLKDLNDYAKVNDIYKDYFPATKPARSAVQVSRLPKDALIEIECIALKKSK